MRWKLPRTFSWLTIALGVILLVASFVRLYNLGGSLLFQGDQGRDAMIVARIFKEADLVFIGPVTSVGNMYLGPLYYYFMLPWLWLSYPSPLGPAYGVAILGIVTVWLMYRLGRELIGVKASLIATSLFAVSAVVVQYSRFSWNPNPAPFVSIIMMWATYRAWQKSGWYWIIVATCLAGLMQLHYLALLSGGGAGLIWLWQQFTLFKEKNWSQLRTAWLGTLLGGLVVLLSLTPLMLFDSRHNWLNVKAFQKLFTEEQSFKVTNTQPWTARVADTVKEMHGRSLHIFWEVPLGQSRGRNTILLIASLLIWARVMTNLKLGPTSKSKTVSSTAPTLAGLIVISSFALTGVLGTAVYDHTVFDHYIAYLFPVTFWVYGVVLGWLWSKPVGKVATVAFVAYFLSYNLPRLPLRSNGWTIYDMERVSQNVLKVVKPGESYGIVLLSESKDLYGQNYRYFLSTSDHPALSPEQVNTADALVIINEEKAVTDPEAIRSLPIWEITTFPAAGSPLVYWNGSEPDLLVLRR